MSGASKKMIVACWTDDDNAMPLAVMIFSILKNIRKEVILHFYIIDRGIHEENKQRLINVFNGHKQFSRHQLELIQPDLDTIKNLSTTLWASHATYWWLLIPQIIPSNVDKVIYLDCNLIVEEDLAKLWENNIEGKALLATVDYGIQYISHPRGLTNYHELGLRADAPYFNGAVLLINLKEWILNKISKKTVEFILKYKDSIKFIEQKALNAILFDKWGLLDPRWNQQSHIFFYNDWPKSLVKERFHKHLNDILRKPFIIQFNPSKPWQYNCQHPAQRRFLYYLRESKWFSKLEWKLWWITLFSKRIKHLYKISKALFAQLLKL